MRKFLLFVLIALLLAVLVFPAVTVNAAETCPTIQNVTMARLDFRDGSERNYLIDVYDQAFKATEGNVAGLEYADSPARWLINGRQIAPDFRYKYSVTYLGEGEFGRLQPVGDAWFGALDAYPGVYFWFVFPVTVTGIEVVNGVQQYAVIWSDHPNCSPEGTYGSVDVATIDALFKPRL